MISERQLVRDLIDLQARKLAEEGYTVIREPDPATLPVSLRSLRPDAIAIGKSPSLVLEVVRPGGKFAERVHRLQEAAAESEWSLQLILDSTPRAGVPAVADRNDIRRLLNEMRRVNDIEPRAALLLGWSALEALARQSDSSRFWKAQSPGRVVEQLAAIGYVLPQEAAELRELANLRNQFIHGGLDVRVDHERVTRFAEMILRLMDEAPPEAA